MMTEVVIRDILTGILVIGGVAVVKTLIAHGNKLVELDARSTTVDQVRKIVDDSYRRLHEDHREFKQDVKDDLQKLSEQVEGVRKAVSRSRANDA